MDNDDFKEIVLEAIYIHVSPHASHGTRITIDDDKIRIDGSLPVVRFARTSLGFMELQRFVDTQKQPHLGVSKFARFSKHPKLKSLVNRFRC